MYDEFDHAFGQRLWGGHRERLHEGGRLSHLVFVDGRLVDAWSEDVRGTTYDEIAHRHDEERVPPVVESPPEPPPRHQQVLEWLDGLVGGRAALTALSAEAPPAPALRDVLDPVADEAWLVVDELLGDLTDSLLHHGLAAPLRHCLLLLREHGADLAERSGPARTTGGIVWVVGKANGELGPAGPVLQKEITARLGLPHQLGSFGQAVSGRVRRLGVARSAPRGLVWRRGPQLPDLLPTGRPELLSTRVRADLVRMRDEALREAVSGG